VKQNNTYHTIYHHFCCCVSVFRRLHWKNEQRYFENFSSIF